jgi:hypothetical protein
MPRLPSIAAALLLALFATACGDGNSDDDTEDLVDLNGTWEFTIDVTRANGVCEGEELDEPSVRPIVVTVAPAAGQPGKVLVTMSGFLGDPANVASTVRDSVRLNSVVTVTGEWPEDGGETEATFAMQVRATDLMQGTEGWEWSRDGSAVDCPDGLSDVRATRMD